MEPEHYLITVDIIPQRLRMHGYLMTDDRRCVTHALDMMVTKAEEYAEGYGCRILPIVLSTTLTGQCRKTVREIVGKHYPQAKEKFKTAKEYHLTVWAWDVSHPDDARLMELH